MMDKKIHGHPLIFLVLVNGSSLHVFRCMGIEILEHSIVSVIRYRRECVHYM